MSIFTDRETAAILAGLGLYQQHYGYVDLEIVALATAGGRFASLSPEDAGRLRERIGRGEPEFRLLDFICDELAGLVMNHIIDGIVLGKDEIVVKIRGWDEPYTIPLGEPHEVPET